MVIAVSEAVTEGDPVLASEDRITTVVTIGWAVGSTGAAIMLNTYGVLLLRFMTDYLGIAAATAGMMIAISKLYDAVIDPLIGAYSDRIKSPMGRRRPFLRVAAVLCPATLLALFVVPRFSSPTILLVYMFVILIAFSTAYAIWSVPYMAMSAEMTESYHERSRLLAFRASAGGIGQLLSALCGPWLLFYWGANRAAYEKIAVVLASMVLVTLFACFRLTRGARNKPKTVADHYGFIERWRLVWNNKPFRLLIIFKSLFFLAVATTASTNAYFTKYILRTSDVWLGTYYMLLTVSLIGSMPIWLRLGRRFGKKACLMAGTAMFGLFNASWLLAAPGEAFVLMAARVLLVGFGLASVVLFAQSMLPDTIEYDFRRTGLRREGAFTGVFVLIEKVATAAGLTLTGLVLGAAGYIESSGGATPIQPASTITALYGTFCGAPAVCAALCLVVLWQYDLPEAKLKSTVRVAEL
jgi:GPH family glycoside/pentoside/hexuronide:cation symporter